jgi:hypothetical protein
MPRPDKTLLARLLSTPPRVLLHKVRLRLERVLRREWQRRLDARRPSYAARHPQLEPLYGYINPLTPELLAPRAERHIALAELFRTHCFDLLGSGWVQVKHGMSCRGLEGRRYRMGVEVDADREGRWLTGRINTVNLIESQRIWALVPEVYQPIDWHLDFKSGYRWPENIWYQDIAYGHEPGVDIKVPWELARMQHLPQLAWAYTLGREGWGPAAAEEYQKEFRHQVLDFIAANPPRFGVNWNCTMDVAIRAANWLVAYDLFRAYGGNFDPPFGQVFCRSLYEHGRHIRGNLEWNYELRSNHYLSNIAGLIFVAAYLPLSREVDAWLAFGVKELIKEVALQFYPDGTNFEASTNYHRLSAEMVVYATALVLGLPPDKLAVLQDNRNFRGTDTGVFPFPGWYLERLEKMAEFTLDLTKPGGHIPQVGDNDSGRFLKLFPVHWPLQVQEAKARYANLEHFESESADGVYWDEDHLDHHHLVAASNGLWGRKDFAQFAAVASLETLLLQGLVPGRRLPSYRTSGKPGGAETWRRGGLEVWEALLERFKASPESGRQENFLTFPDQDLLKDLRLLAYPDFGLYLFKSPRLYLAVRCGPLGQNGVGGHAHNDQLSLELTVDGEDRLLDPGTYLYTPLPAGRNEYRSLKAHFSPQVEREPGRLDLGLFRLGNEAVAECLYFGEQGFAGSLHCGADTKVYRLIRVEENGLHLLDWTEGQLALKKAPFGKGRSLLPFSPGYGLKYKD